MARKKQGKRQLYSGDTYLPTPVPGVYIDVPAPKKKIIVVAPTGRRKKAADDPMLNHIEGADWWLALSAHPVRKLMRMYRKQDVSSVLLERTGAMQEFDSFYSATWRFLRENPNSHDDEIHVGGTLWRIAIQITDFVSSQGEIDIDVDVSLVDAGIYLEEMWTPPDQ
jgi:hypothetical protein